MAERTERAREASAPARVAPAGLAVLLIAVLAFVAALGGCGASSGPLAETGGTARAAGVTPATPASPSPVATPGIAFGGPTVPDRPPMKTIGIIGGVSWVSSAEYYRIMNVYVRDHYGPDCSAKILMYSIPFGAFSQVERLADKGDWDPLRNVMIDAARRLQAGGADFIVICSNTMNSTAGVIERHVRIPVLLIQDAVGRAVRKAGITTVALLGTKFTMEQPFYRDRLRQKYGLDVVIPDRRERDYINNVIFDQLCADRVTAAARRHFVRIIERLVTREGAQGVILGCTEIPLLIKQKDVSVPVFDSTRLHALAAVRYALDVK